MNEQDFLKLLNAVAKIAKPFHDDLAEVTDLNQLLDQVGLDSLDLLLVSVYLCDVFKIDEELGKTLQARTPKEFYDWLMQNKSHTPSSVEEALESVQ